LRLREARESYRRAIAVIYCYFVLALQILSLYPAFIFISETDRRISSREKMSSHLCEVKHPFDEIFDWRSYLFFCFQAPVTNLFKTSGGRIDH
jgi:hypothetical protein